MKILLGLLVLLLSQAVSAANFYPIVDCPVAGGIIDIPAKTDGTFYRSGPDCIRSYQLAADESIYDIVQNGITQGSFKYTSDYWTSRGINPFGASFYVEFGTCPSGSQYNSITLACESPPVCNIPQGTTQVFNGSGGAPQTFCIEDCSFTQGGVVVELADGTYSGDYVSTGQSCQPPLPGLGGSNYPNGSGTPKPPTSCPSGQILVNDICTPSCPYNPAIPAVDVNCNAPPPDGGTGGTGGTGGSGGSTGGTGTTPTTNSTEVTSGDAAIVEAINNLRSEEQNREGRLDSALAERDGAGLVIPKETYDFTGAFSTVSFNSSAVCPSPISFSMLGTTYSLSFEPLCEIMVIMRPLVIAMGMFTAFFIFLGGFKI